MAPELPILVTPTLCDIWYLMFVGRGCHFGSNGPIYIFNFSFLYTVFNFKVKKLLFYVFFSLFFIFFFFFFFCFWLIAIGLHTYGLYMETFFMCKSPYPITTLSWDIKTNQHGLDGTDYHIQYFEIKIGKLNLFLK